MYDDETIKQVIKELRDKKTKALFGDEKDAIEFCKYANSVLNMLHPIDKEIWRDEVGYIKRRYGLTDRIINLSR